MKKKYQIVGLCLFMFTALQSIQAQLGGKGSATVTINGPVNVGVGTSETYTITTSAGLTITGSNWTVIGGGGTVQNPTHTSVTINCLVLKYGYRLK